MRFETEDKGNYQETLVFFSSLAIQEKPSPPGKLANVTHCHPSMLSRYPL